MVQSEQKILFEKTEFRDMFGGMKHMQKTIGEVDENVPDAMVGGFMSALEELGQ